MKKIITVCLLSAMSILTFASDSKSNNNHPDIAQGEKGALAKMAEAMRKYQNGEVQPVLDSSFPDGDSIPLSECSTNTCWKQSNDTTNAVVISVVVGMTMMGGSPDIPYVRDLVFDGNGRLVSVSKARIGVVVKNALLGSHTLEATPQPNQHIQDHDK